MHTGYFWLNDEQRLVMDAARTTAADYPYIGLFSVGKAWKRHVEAMVGSKVDPANYLRAYNVTGSCQFGDWRSRKEVRAIIRLNPTQAMVFKLRHGGSNEAWIVADPTGESWGNMQIAQHSRKHLSYEGKDNLFKERWSYRAFNAMLDGHAFGPTLATVSTHCDALPIHMAVPCVNWNHWGWHDANDNVVFLSPKIVGRWKWDEQGRRSWETVSLDLTAFNVPVPIKGVATARDFYQDYWQKEQELKDYYEL